jgi:hypothetical protein
MPEPESLREGWKVHEAESPHAEAQAGQESLLRIYRHGLENSFRS